MDIQQGSDYTDSYRGTRRITDGVRAGISQTYALGQLVKFAPLDSQQYSDGATVIPTAAADLEKLVVGVISEDWKGLDGAGALASGSALIRGTQTVKVTCYGYHPSVLIDNTNGTAASTTNGVTLSSSQNAAGKVQGETSKATTGACEVGYAMLPASGIGATLGNGAVTAASQTYTVTGTATVGDVYTVTLSVPFAGSPTNIISQGVAQTRTISVTTNTAGAVSLTTSALQILTAINADPVFSVFYKATQSAGAITITVVAAQFFVTTANSPFQFFYVTTSGNVGNSLTIAGTVTGTAGLTVGGANFASGAGYVGTTPAFIRRL